MEGAGGTANYGGGAGRRDNIRPVRPLPHSTRDKVRPATSITSNLGCFERAGRTFPRTGRSDVGTMTPLQPLKQTSMKPPSPLRAPEQQPLKPTTPLRPQNAPRTPISHPQRRHRFQLRLGRRPQRRHRFHAKGLRHPHVASNPLLRKLARSSIGPTPQQHSETLKYQQSQFKF